MKYFLILFLVIIGCNTFSQGWTNDASFYVGTGANSVTGIQKMIEQSDGKILIHGSFTSFNDTVVNRLARLNINGSLDTSFNSGSGPDNYIYSLMIVSNEKIIISGNFLTYDGFSYGRIARLNSDGSIDTNFNPGTGADATISNAVLQPDGKIIICGQFTSFNGVPRNRIARLNEDGSLDLSFDPGTAANGNIFRSLVQPDGKIIICGSFNNFNLVPVNNIARLNSNGSIDTNFYISSPSYQPILRILLQGDGKILVFGGFTEFNGVLKNHIVRLLSDGNLDNSFDSGSGVNDVVALQANLQPDDKIIVYGSFITYNDTTTNRIVRLNSDGSIDSLFNIMSGADDWVHAVSIGSNGKIVVAGKFTSFNGELRNNITRLVNCVPVSFQEVQIACDSLTWLINGQTYLSSGTYIDTITNTNGCDSIITLNLTIIPSLPLTVNLFSQPSDANSCVGSLSISATGTPDFIQTIDGGSSFIHSGYTLVNDLCPGVHSLFTINGCGDTLTQPFVIPVDSNYIFNNPFIDSIAVDSLGTTMEDCEIYYNGIDTAYIDSIFATGNTVTVIWNIVDSNGSNLDTSTYELNNGNGDYYLQLSVFCPTKALGDYFTVTEAIYFEDGNISTASLAVLDDDLFQLFPNPTNDLVTIRFEVPKAELAIYEAQGKHIQTQTIQSGDIVSLGKLETGIYFFELTTGTGRTVKRVVKQ